MQVLERQGTLSWNRPEHPLQEVTCTGPGQERPDPAGAQRSTSTSRGRPHMKCPTGLGVPDPGHSFLKLPRLLHVLFSLPRPLSLLYPFPLLAPGLSPFSCVWYPSASCNSLIIHRIKITCSHISFDFLVHRLLEESHPLLFTTIYLSRAWHMVGTQKNIC